MIIPHNQYVISLSLKCLEDVEAKLEERHSLAARVSATTWGIFCATPARATATTVALTFTAQPFIELSSLVLFPAMLTAYGVAWYNGPSFVSLSSSRTCLQELKKLHAEGDLEAFWEYAFSHIEDELLSIPQFGIPFILQLFLRHLYNGNKPELSEVSAMIKKIIDNLNGFERWKQLVNFAYNDPEVLLVAMGKEKIKELKPARELLDLVGTFVRSEESVDNPASDGALLEGS